jgi:1-pyrroline-5-carboxylate dehydrogenase
MSAGLFQPPTPRNESVSSFAPGTAERSALQQELSRQSGEEVEIPCVVNGKEVRTPRKVDVVMPCAHAHRLGRSWLATPELTGEAIDGALAARRHWAELPWEERAAVFLRAAELLAGPWRHKINASTMLGQAKTSYQAEIDAACELIDFWRFNVAYMRQIYSEQPPVSAPGTWNRTDWRPLEGFVFAVTPFNFTSIALNLPTAPVLMGNVAIWKPAITQLHSAWLGYQLLVEAGLPPGVIQFLPGTGPDVGDVVLNSPHFGGLHFTGSTGTFQQLWAGIGQRITRYRSWPRIVGETGGKDFIIAHPSADAKAVSTAILRGAFEYQGQKCSAASRMYIPASLWPEVRDRTIAEMGRMKVGDVRDFSTFIGAVIDRRAFDKHQGYLHLARDTGHILAGGEADDAVGYYVKPTLVQVDDPRHRLMSEEIFGPIASAFVYPDAQWAEALRLVDTTSPYALTGAVFARDRYAIDQASRALRDAAGNFYINDKPTGAVVGQQPFGGARGSGTNDKAGAPGNLLRWLSPRTLKETMVPPTDWRYPYLG